MPPERLDEWLKRQDRAVFPNNTDYPLRFTQMAEYLNTTVHTVVNRAAILAQLQTNGVPFEQLVLLTCHGPGHVDCVIERATALLHSAGYELDPYECFLLLAAIEFHDVGNVFGRREHEARCGEIITTLGPTVFPDGFEMRAIRDIAASHGGCANGDRDTIGRLEVHKTISHKRVQKRKLAAILRFADELADDRTRASRFMMEHNMIPAASKLYHEYSHALHSVVSGPHEVCLAFEMSETSAQERFQKGETQVYLLDEIYARTLKMHQERSYCMRFLRGTGISVDRIRVEIEVVSDMKADTISEPRERIQYTLEDSGYPETAGGIQSICPDLEGRDGKWLKRRLNEGLDA